MDRKFGIELELIGITREQAIAALTGVGIEVREEGYNHETRRHWKIVSDASVRGGFELVSPVLQGDAGLNSRVLQVLAENGFDSRTPTLPI